MLAGWAAEQDLAGLPTHVLGVGAGADFAMRLPQAVRVSGVIAGRRGGVGGWGVGWGVCGWGGGGGGPMS